jgi:hypothetical protein
MALKPTATPPPPGVAFTNGAAIGRQMMAVIWMMIVI